MSIFAVYCNFPITPRQITGTGMLHKFTAPPRQLKHEISSSVPWKIYTILIAFWIAGEHAKIHDCFSNWKSLVICAIFTSISTTCHLGMVSQIALQGHLQHQENMAFERFPTPLRSWPIRYIIPLVSYRKRFIGPCFLWRWCKLSLRHFWRFNSIDTQIECR